tara:strand:+ start:448 stop:702 length:255 start_codon:yes stop_codon:yes gene_type:complete
MKFFVVALVSLMGGEHQAVSVMQLPFTTMESCKEYVMDNGHMLQNDVEIMYPASDGFSLTCMTEKDAKKEILKIQSENMEKKYI